MGWSKPDGGGLASWSAEHGLIHTAEAPVFRDTPLLACGRSQSGTDGFTGSIFGLRGTIYEHVRHGDADGLDSGSHLIVLHLSFSLPRLPYLLVHARGPGSALERLSLHLTDNRLVELESSELAERLTIEVNRCTSDVALRELLTPETIVQLLDLTERSLFADGVFLEAYAGKLVIATPGTIDEDPATLDELLAGTEPIVAALKTFAEQPSGQLA
jgi:hypothetical protein